MRFLANENIPPATIRLLRQAGMDVVAIGEESPGITDRVVLARARNEQRIILTFDRDYGELIYRHQLSPPAGIVYLRFSPLTPEEPAEYLLRLVTIESLDFAGKFTVADRQKVRQRLL